MSPQRNAPAHLTADASSRRGEYLRTLTGLLWPHGAAQVERRRRGSGPLRLEYLVIPDARRPRLLVPVGRRAAAAAAVRRYSEPSGRLDRLKREAVAWGVRTGAAELLLRDRVRVRPTSADDGAGSVEDHLRAVLGNVVLSVHVGPARANRKPVLQVLTPDGRTVGFVKIGVNDLTRQLVRQEAEALSRLERAPLTEVQAPRVLHTGTWKGLEVLVQSALPVWRRRVGFDAGRLVRGMREVAAIGGVEAHPLASSSYWTRLTARVAALRDDDTREALRGACRAMAEQWSHRTLRFGSWHGDWSPWNLAFLPDRLLVWDWERFASPAPVGLDAVHYQLQRAVVSEHVEPRRAVEETIAAAPRVLEPFDVPADDAVAVALLYLVDIAARYAGDGQAEAGARLGVLGSWLLPAIADHAVLAASGSGDRPSTRTRSGRTA